ncbi:MAG TPA: hypothetical protein VF494_04485 [Candidatus Limnocylindrales bacterium]
MGALVVRLASLTLGLGLTEIGLGDALFRGLATGWLMLAVGLLMIVAGTAGFIGPLLASGQATKGRDDD